ncbi:GtrA family protein [Mesorhizobium sp. M00.F.Ca.ET.151.01.1.1]|uniref:GtrA family protein n=1 Tax=Stenotrophomonas pavanii TaxID=487698 RepID=UPI0011355B85|nr:GtrA family protein [Stenotrophomonas pavanii]MBN7837915.1 GtrA family protein [Stenotrophomonas maltophilia]TGR49971.1 GtrA family protein [bacterium M00.F.Ca.ET.199.01.1.1]TGT06184.1 GtrA family protein [bacterium M00.F.Ca.ET.177.01.1.1]TGT61806.1 GtrA family protein [Mesorhizobium sp. M00.F.Ca.ET.170.01.1.1]TGU13409.1 GtrA family protein [bacterium M00.F.Ca.ET.163.01.1.1]TGU95369.1 GtrA family protein [Mesorhizobium sp. M00.F.Ca.ET.151.01.1.1]TGV57124.1 GtrA family protein [bacterium M
MLSRQFMMFLLVGGIAALANFLSRIFYSLWLDFTPAIILAYVTGMITAFVLSKLFVFRDSKQPLHHSAFYFVLVNLVAVAQTWIVSTVLAFYVLPMLSIDTLRMEIAHAVGVAVPVFSSYVGHKYLSFR